MSAIDALARIKARDLAAHDTACLNEAADLAAKYNDEVQALKERQASRRQQIDADHAEVSTGIIVSE